MNLRKSFRHVLAAFALMAVAVPFMAAPTLAEDTVTQEITSTGVLSASVTDATLTPVTYSNTAGSSGGSLLLTVADGRGTAAGWSVSISSTAFDYTGSNTAGADIPATGFAIASTGAPAVSAGQPVGTGGPTAQSSTGVGTLDTARVTIAASSGAGSGTYTQSLPVTLVIPAYSLVGTYVADLTVLTAAAP